MEHTSLKRWLRYLVLVLLALVMLLPFYWTIAGSLKSSREMFAYPMVFWPSVPQWGNFVQIFRDVPYVRYLFNSLFVSTTVTVVALLFHSMAAYSLARLDYPWREQIFVAVVSTLLIPGTIIMIPLFIIIRAFGWIDTYWGLIVPAIPNAFGIFLLRQFYITVPRDLEESAIIDGCSLVQVYYHVFLRLSKPIMGALGVFFFLANWNAFLWPLLVINKPEMRTVQLGISQYTGQYTNPWGYLLAASVVAIAPTLLVFFILQKSLVQGIVMTGIKD